MGKEKSTKIKQFDYKGIQTHSVKVSIICYGSEKFNSAVGTQVITCNKVTAHENFLQLVIVFVFPDPDRIVLRVKFLPEIRNRFGFIFIGVAAFEVIHIETAVRVRNTRVYTYTINKGWDSNKDRHLPHGEATNFNIFNSK